MLVVRNHRIQINVGPFGSTTREKLTDRLLNAGVCITYTGTTQDNAVWIEGKPDHLKSLIRYIDLDTITPMQMSPHYKIRTLDEIE